ncbi:hypothetical protein SEA_WOFFORD_230 [Streptomyces phage Wofford]|uniref:Uncharacterized protein n=1 Tax=Streptomyces phage Wofford TaxID=2283267 RepID=A0A345MA45_9CAUD|nr:hypothetical protein HWB78_gp088 [Streptomyces phage Wollford]AXH67366.1 hypothetical protein SEA_WOFFORD_230 [Streptomyces phage Wollford]
MTYSEMRIDMRIRHITTGLKATIGKIEGGKFTYVDEKGRTRTLDRYYAGEWERII